MANLDEKDCIILNLLQENCRITLTAISGNLGLSVDSVKKRINRMIREDVFYPKIQLRPRNFGFMNIVDIKMKLHNYNNHDLQRFIKYLQGHPNVAEIFSISGEWNFSVVLIAKDALDLGNVWRSVLNEKSSI